MSPPVRQPRDSRARGPHGPHRRAYEVVLRRFADAVGADTAMLLGHGGGRGEMLASWAREGQELRVGWTGDALLAQALNGSGPVLDPATPTEDSAAVAAIAAPIHRDSRVLGAIYASFSPPTTEPPEDLGWIADCYGRTAALCMTGDLALAELLGSVGFDPLTGCLSYGGLLEVIKAEIQRSMRGRHRLSCCFLDLDDFKRVNDENGHLEGNRVLAAVGRALRQAARTYDAVGRFGGDEFVVVLPETGAGAGASTARRYRTAVLDALRETTLVPVEVSIGIAEWDGSGSAAELLDAADSALALAKAGGGAEISPNSSRRLGTVLDLTRDLIRRRRREPGDGDRSRWRHRP